MRRRTRYLTVSLDESQVVSAAWASHPRIDKDIADHVFFGSRVSKSELHSGALARYNFKADLLSEPKAVFTMDEGSPPRKVAVHPGGDGVVISFETGCKFFEWDKYSGPSTESTTGMDLKLRRSERILGGLEDVGPQNCLLFAGDGSLLASAGEDGHIRVFRWPSMDAVLDVAKAFNKSIKDLDISLDSAYLSATAENSPCCVWDLSNSQLLATLQPIAGEILGFCRFSRDGQRPFLFITVTKEKKGFVGVWDLCTWKRIGAKRFHHQPITSLAVTHHGRRLAIGSLGGDISIIEIKKMELQQVIKGAHLQSVISLEFSFNDKAVLSLSSDYSSRVSALDLSKEWKEWQLYLVLLGLFLASMVLFYLFHLFGDAFWQFPMGRDQPAIPPIEAILSDDEWATHTRSQEL